MSWRRSSLPLEGRVAREAGRLGLRRQRSTSFYLWGKSGGDPTRTLRGHPPLKGEGAR